MIQYPRGWSTRLFRLSGAMAQTLHLALTQNRCHPNGPTDTHYITCLHKRSHAWLADLNHPLSFIAKERWAFLQIALTQVIHYLGEVTTTLGTPHPSNLSLVLPDPLGFPALGLRNKHVIFLLTCRFSPSQGVSTYLQKLDQANATFKAQGLWPRWVMPHSGHIPKDTKFQWEPIGRTSLAIETPDGAFWPLLDASFLEDLDQGANRFHLNLDDLLLDYDD